MNIVLGIAVILFLFFTEDDIGTRPDYCNDGYKGVFCENRCPYPTFGSQCNERCQCSTEFCHHISGCRAPDDNCPVGFMGKYCREKCRFPQYGYGCQQKCLCPESYCHFEKGCLRQKFSPKNLNRKDLLFKNQPDEEESTKKPYSPSTTYTAGKSFIIAMKKRKTDYDSCPVGFMGKYCKDMCHFPTYGYGCQLKCPCPKSYCHFEKDVFDKKFLQKMIVVLLVLWGNIVKTCVIFQHTDMVVN